MAWNIPKIVFAICFFEEFKILRFRISMQPQAGERQGIRRSTDSYPKSPSQVTMGRQDCKCIGKKNIREESCRGGEVMWSELH